MYRFFLSADTPLTKRFERVDGVLIKHPYPHIDRFTSHQETATTIQRFHELLIQHAEAGHCLLKGQLEGTLTNQSRAGRTQSNEKTDWVCLDVDGLQGIEDPEDLIKEIPELQDVSYILQHSASSGIDKERGLSVHLFFLLDKPVEAPLLKEWLINLNRTIPLLFRGLRLTRTNNALRYPLDVTTCQNDKLIYIAPPILGPGMRDRMKQKRIELRMRHTPKLSIDFSTIVPGANKVQITKIINTMREKISLAPLNTRVQTLKSGTVIMLKPDECRVTDHKQERGFTYLNLNGGDSWGYYHPSDNPEVLYNFKGEPNYALKALCPNYYAEVTGQLKEAKSTAATSNGVQYLAFRDYIADQYFAGKWNPATDELDIHVISNLKKIKDYFEDEGLEMPSPVPSWTCQFRFDDPRHIDLSNKFLNWYTPSPYMRDTPVLSRAVVPNVILKIITHVCGNDDVSAEHFLNWLAVIFQKRIRTQTLWVFNGVPGTGKGVMMNYILTPIFGKAYCTTKSAADLEEKYNAYMERCVILMVDEMDQASMKNAALVMAKLKNNSVEPTISIRRMQANHFDSINYMNIIISSNFDDPIVVDPADRRFNVAGYQPNKIEISPEEFARIDGELPAFATYLASRPADEILARTPLDNSARKHLIHISRPAADVVSDAILCGDLQFFVDQLPTEGYVNSADRDGLLNIGPYRELIGECLESIGMPSKLSRDQLRTLFAYCVGNMPVSPNKFTSFIKHHKLRVDRIRIGDKVVQGIAVEWRGNQEELRKCLQPSNQPPGKKLPARPAVH